MPSGDSMVDLLCRVDPREAELIEWHLDNGTPASWLSDTLSERVASISRTTVKDYRRRVGRRPVRGDGRPTEGLLEALEARRRLTEDKAARDSAPRILTLDIERLPGVVVAPFWDMKSLMGRRIDPSWVREWPRTICLAARWLGEDEVKFYSEWELGHEAMIRAAWSLYDEADVVVGHNLARFDTKKLRSEWALYGQHDPSPFKVVDTMRVAFDRFGFESNTLNALCERFGVEAKVDKYDATVAKAALDGDETAQRRLQAYNEGDVIATEALYLAFRQRGYIPGHPVMAPNVGMRCTSCGGGDLEPMDQPYVANVMAYRAYRCGSCGTVLRDFRGERITRLRGVKS